MSIQLGSAYGKVVIDSSGVTKGVEAAEKSLMGLNDKTVALGKTAKTFGDKLVNMDMWFRRNSDSISRFGEMTQEAGRKMMTFTAVPIIAFLGLLIKKAIDAKTELGILAKESIGKLSESLAKLGDKFLPLFIKIVDWLTMMIDKFLAADPATQKFITMLIIGFGVILPIVLQLAGGLIQLAGVLGTMGIGVGSATAALGTIGTVITGTLLPAFSSFFTYITATAIPAIVAFAVANAGWIVPLLLVIATLYLLYKAWETNFGGIRTTLNQLTYLLGYSINKWIERFRAVGTTIQQLWALIKMAFMDGIGKAIDWVVSKIDRLKAALASIKLPKALTPGSPTPFETGLRGIASAMDLVANKNIPNFQSGMSSNALARSIAKPAQNMNQNQSTSNTINLSGGLTLRDVDALMSQRINQFTKRLDRAMGGA
jgi:hypothetical protein